MMSSEEIIEALLAYNNEQCGILEKQIKQVEDVIDRRVKDKHYELYDLLRTRDKLIAKRDTYYTMPGMVETLKEGESDE